MWRLQTSGGARLAAGPVLDGPQQMIPKDVLLDDLLARGGDALRDALRHTTNEVLESGARLLCPLESQEVWASGVTFERSRAARNQEAHREVGVVDFYNRVYDAERPELFPKAGVGRSRGPNEPVTIRSDSGWDVPEPELGVVADSGGRIVAYTIGNDMSSRSIEAENPLYLPQALVYAGSCAIGPSLLPARDAPSVQDLQIRLTIERDGKDFYRNQVSVSTMHRELDELVDWLFRSQDFPVGVALLTGTSIVPPLEFTLHEGDVVTVEIPGIGLLRNPVDIRDTRSRRR